MSNFSILLAALLPVLGIIIGATLQYLYSRSSEIHKQHYISKSQAYIDYLQCVAELANIAKFQKNYKRNELLSKTADAKTRICIYGSKSVVEALANFEKSGARIDNHESAEKFLLVCQEMRKDGLGKKSESTIKDLGFVLFGFKGSKDYKIN